jgi:hypothetical protein
MSPALVTIPEWVSAALSRVASRIGGGVGVTPLGGISVSVHLVKAAGAGTVIAVGKQLELLGDGVSSRGDL